MARGFVLCSGACRLVASMNRVHCSFFVEKCYLSVELSKNCLVFDDWIVEVSFPGSIRQKAVNCLFNNKILSLV